MILTEIAMAICKTVFMFTDDVIRIEVCTKQTYFISSGKTDFFFMPGHPCSTTEPHFKAVFKKCSSAIWIMALGHITVLLQLCLIVQPLLFLMLLCPVHVKCVYCTTVMSAKTCFSN